MALSEPVDELATIESPDRASALLHPLRLRLLALAREPVSAADLARKVSLPRQRVNYHVRALSQAGLLKPAGRRRRRNLYEQRYQATARAYVLDPALLGPLAADWRAIADKASSAYLIALSEQVRADVSRGAEAARQEGKRLATFSLKSQFRFLSPEQRAEFAEAVRRALVDVIARHTSPDRREGGRPGRGRPFRLVLVCYPAPPEEEGDSE